MQTQSFGGNRYFITFTNDYSRSCKVYFLKKKSEAFEKFKEFKAAAEQECGRKVKALRADRGGEYLSKEFKCYLKEHVIRSEFIAAYSPQQNGVAERMNRTLVEAARSMLSHACLSNAYWAEGVATAAYLRNRMVTTALKSDQTPYQCWYGEKPNLKYIRVFGCTVYADIPDGDRKKLDKKAQKLKFIGYTETTGNYRVWDEKKRKCYICHDVIFNESDFGKQKEKNVVKPGEEPQVELELKIKKPEDQQVQDESEEEEDPALRAPPRCSQRVKKPVIRCGRDECANSSAKAQHIACRASEIEEPSTIKEALDSNYSKEWKLAADAEYNSLMENNTWELVKLPEGRKAIG